MRLKAFVENRQQRINTFLTTILPDPLLAPTHLHEAMHYAVLNGGKRIRPLLVYATGEALGVDLSLLDYPASAIELIHAYSLVHDDLPAMDDDDLRRGKPTCHKAFDEATAILVGDSLQSLAFSILADQRQQLTPEIRIAMISCVAKASGSHGMAGGQALDLKATGQQLDHHQLETIHHLKTGALICAGVQLGYLSGKMNQPTIANTLVTFANYLGLCFQIQDDILDVEGTTPILGKQVGGDQAKKKMTFTSLHGIGNAKKSLYLYHQAALAALQPLGDRADTLRLLTDFIVSRDH